MGRPDALNQFCPLGHAIIDLVNSFHLAQMYCCIGVCGRFDLGNLFLGQITIYFKRQIPVRLLNRTGNLIMNVDFIV